MGCWFTRVVLCVYSDLVHTTESLRNAKLSAGKTEKESRNLDALLEPHRAENARVVRENNELHLQLLKLKEEKDRFTRGRFSQVFRGLRSCAAVGFCEGFFS